MKKYVAAIAGLLVLAALVAAIGLLNAVRNDVSSLAGAQRQAGETAGAARQTAESAAQAAAAASENARAAQAAAANAADAAAQAVETANGASWRLCPGNDPDTDCDGDGVPNTEDHCRFDPADPDAGAVDPTRPGCRAPLVDAGMPAVDADPDAATLPAVDPDAATPPAVDPDATVASNGDSETTVVVQADPDAGTPAVAPAAPVPVATSSDTTSGNAVAVELGVTSPAAQRFCDSVNRRTLAAIQLAGASDCGRTERWCFRLVTPDVMPTACDPHAPTPGCVMASGALNPCVRGAESVVVVRYGAGLRDRTPAGVAAAITAARRTTSRRSHGGSFVLGPLRAGISWP